MRRADRLFQIVNYLRRNKIATARQIARALEVSERTIYRDMADLSLSGIPLEAEAGVGYRLGPQCDLPPLMFDSEELEALTLGARMAEAWGDESLARAARSVLDKVALVLPKDLKAEIESTTLFAPDFHVAPEVKRRVGLARVALRTRRLLSMHYRKANGEESMRIVRPLGLYFWGSTWSLVSYCELRDGFRNFRLDRMLALELLEQSFSYDPQKSLVRFLEELRLEGRDRS